MRKLNKDQIEELADHLRGSCVTFSQAMASCGFGGYDEDNARMRIERDHELFLCECGWWCLTEEQDEEGLCEDCHVAETCDNCGEEDCMGFCDEDEDDGLDRCDECGKIVDFCECEDVD